MSRRLYRRIDDALLLMVSAVFSHWLGYWWLLDDAAGWWLVSMREWRDQWNFHRFEGLLRRELRQTEFHALALVFHYTVTLIGTYSGYWASHGRGGGAIRCANLIGKLNCSSVSLIFVQPAVIIVQLCKLLWHVRVRRVTSGRWGQFIRPFRRILGDFDEMGKVIKWANRKNILQVT